VTRQTPLSRGAIASVLAALKLADLQGFDPQPENAVAAGSFCFAPPGLPPQQVPISIAFQAVLCWLHAALAMMSWGPEPNSPLFQHQGAVSKGVCARTPRRVMQLQRGHCTCRSRRPQLLAILNPKLCAQVLLLVRIEVDVSSHTQFQVTVASPDVQLTAAAKNVLLLQLVGMPSA
jgi:hypothetical protein